MYYVNFVCNKKNAILIYSEMQIYCVFWNTFKIFFSIFLEHLLILITFSL